MTRTTINLSEVAFRNCYGMLAVCAAQQLHAIRSWYQVSPRSADFWEPASRIQQFI